ncbi:MAG TPA: catalase family peroxidase [Solirubrobacteraceae bacterium]|nr:catalase family peroxidase [Solirubrobacteraceae bacterium]
MSITPQQTIDAANQVFGSHPGFRALHAKGTLCKATFTATPEAARLTRAAHMQGDPIEATVRVSNGGGDPDVPDYQPDVRGLAVKLYLPDGTRTDIVTQTVPRFPVRTPEAFAELMLAQRPSPAMVWRMPLFLARNPRALVTVPGGLPALKPVASYATCRYYGTHAFRFLDAQGGSRYARYTLLPEAGEGRLSVRGARRRGPDYLQEDIRQRLDRGLVRFTLELQIAGPDDAVDDPTAVWPSQRERVRAGMLELTAIETERETNGDVLVFDPTRITDGIELSDDPILQFRHRAYTESVARRMG